MWIVVVLLSMIGFGIKRTLAEIDDLHTTAVSNRSAIALNSGRLAVLEKQAEEFHDSIKDLRKTQLESLIELKGINATLKK